MLLEEGEDRITNLFGIEEGVGIFRREVAAAHGCVGSLGNKRVDEEVGSFFGKALREIDDSGFGACIDGVIFSSAHVS